VGRGLEAEAVKLSNGTMQSRRTTQHTSRTHRSLEEPVRIRLLGGFSVSVGPRTIEESAWRLRKSASLVKLLALSSGHRMHRERVLDLLWPELGRGAAANNLRQALYAARQALEPERVADSRYLVSQGESLALCPRGELWVDVDAFEAAVATARRSHDPAAYRVAIDLYPGELLPDDRYEEWVESRHRELGGTFLSVLIELAGLYEERGEYRRGVETLQRSLSAEPTNEVVHAGLMRLHALSGRRQEALSQFEQLGTVLSGQLGTEPDATTRRLRDEIAAGEFPSFPHSRVAPPQEESSDHNLPAPRTSFVGRELEIFELKKTLPMTRLLTLTGAGGSGKTRLALEVARDLLGSYADGVWLVELAPLSEPGLVAQEVARALGAQEQPGRPLLESLLDTLDDKEMLLLLDNCEHLIDAVASLTIALLDSCPRLTVLATSRERLGVTGEVTWLVPPLSVPGTGDTLTVEELEGYESARLFADRASKGHTGFELTPENARAVAQVCTRLEGIPLAIELAAARVGILSAGQIFERLDHSLKLLTGDERTADHRHRTLRATLDWGYQLLDEPEQALFGRLSAFAGGFTLKAAERVGARGEGIEEEDVLELLTMLVDKSLVVAEESWERGARFRLLEPVRQYAREQLNASGEAEAIGSRHAEFFLALAEEAEPELKGPRQVEWLDRLETEHDNLRAALSWSLGRGGDVGPRMAVALCLFWYTRGYLSEGRTYLEEVARSDVVPARVRARALDGLGWIAEPQGDYERARTAYEKSLELYRGSHDKKGVANALGDLGSLALDRGDYERATSLLKQSLTLHRELGSREDLIGILDGLGVLASAQGEQEQSISFFSEALALSRGTGNVRRTAVSLGNLGFTLLAHGDPGQAKALLDESLALFREIGDSSNIAVSLMNSALATLSKGDHGRVQALCEESLKLLQKAQDTQHIADCLGIMASAAGARGSAKRAARLWGAAEALREEVGVPLQPEDRVVLDPYLATARSSLGEIAWRTTLVEGRAMTSEQAIEYALDAGEPLLPSLATHRSGENTTALTPREEEVAVLVSRGLTNRQIASELSISEHTVATHIAKILKRLGLSSRSRLSAWVAERGLPQTFQSS
jgi:predicted ATPase/DNA-binding SARP family transcriptional activator/DNA-binding CsgD family transcriptional regulator/Flp pilus assembly protein TadD